jgi:hypothetical protein
MKPPCKITPANICQFLIGEYLGTNQNGNAGRELENLLESWGLSINRGHGPDILIFRWELKSRDLDAISPHTIADMNIDDIRNCSYRNSHVRTKFQTQLRVYTRYGTIVDAGIYDFSDPDIQEIIEKAYEHARQQLIKDPSLECTRHAGFYAYFERKQNCETSYSFRVSYRDMPVLEGMARSTFGKMFVYG